MVGFNRFPVRFITRSTSVGILAALDASVEALTRYSAMKVGQRSFEVFILSGNVDLGAIGIARPSDGSAFAYFKGFIHSLRFIKVKR
jgi:hypothetical protein